MPYFYGPGAGIPWRDLPANSSPSPRPQRPAAQPAAPPPEAAPQQQPAASPSPSPPSPGIDADFHLAATLQGLGEAVLLTNGAGIIEMVNPEVERLWGYPRHKVVGKKLSLLISNEARDRVGATGAKEDLAGGTVRRLRVDAYRADGTAFPVEVRISRYEAFGPVRFLVAVRDLTELVRAEERLRSLEKALSTMNVGVCVTDLDHRIVYANPAQARMHGYEPDELAGGDARALNPEAFAFSYEELLRVQTWRRESEDLRKDGGRFAVELVSDVVTGSRGEPLGMVTICQDITERKRAEAALRESEERYALAVRGTNDGIWDWDLRADRVYFSPRWKEMLGYKEPEVGETSGDWLRRVHPQDIKPLERDLADYLAGETPHFENQHRMLHRDGTWRWMLCRGTALRDGSGHAVRLAGSQTDITDRAVQDTLTELPSRSLFMDRLGTALERFRQRGEVCAVLFLDLDHFKTVNDTLGHEAGDRLLIGVARRLEACVGPQDTVTRLGGDEFAVLLGAANEGRAREVAQRIQRELARPVRLAGREVTVQGSLGIALSSATCNRAEEILRAADTAMYRAKSMASARRTA